MLSPDSLLACSGAMVHQFWDIYTLRYLMHSKNHRNHLAKVYQHKTAHGCCGGRWNRHLNTVDALVCLEGEKHSIYVLVFVGVHYTTMDLELLLLCSIIYVCDTGTDTHPPKWDIMA